MATSEFYNALIASIHPDSAAWIDNVLLEAEHPLTSDVQLHGLVPSRKKDPQGEERQGITSFQPAYPMSLDLLLTLANNMPLSVKRTDGSSPVVSHTALDLPKRAERNTGLYNPRFIGAFLLALVGRIVESSDGDLAFYLRSQDKAKKLYSGSANATGQLLADMRDDREMRTTFTEQPSLKGLLKLVDLSVSDDDDSVVVYSDFLDGYDATLKQFSWQDQMQQLHQRMQDRLLVVGYTSEAQNGPIPGATSMLDARTAQRIMVQNEAFMQELRGAQQTALQGIRMVWIDTYSNADHPVPTLVKFFTEQQ